MDRIYTTGETILGIKTHRDYATIKYYVSILSRRACRHVLRRSQDGTWEKPVCRMVPEITAGQYIIAGFQPDTGMCVGYQADTKNR